MAGGHTHIQMLRQYQGVLLVNAGSVGAPFKLVRAAGRPRPIAVSVATNPAQRSLHCAEVRNEAALDVVKGARA